MKPNRPTKPRSVFISADALRAIEARQAWRGKRLLERTIRRTYHTIGFVVGWLLLAPLFFLMGTISLRELGQHLITVGTKFQRYGW
jgi:hypothetical protein